MPPQRPDPSAFDSASSPSSLPPGADADSSGFNSTGFNSTGFSATGSEASSGKRRRRSSSSRGAVASASPVPRPLALWALAGLTLAISAWLLPQAWRQLAGDLIASPARVTINPQASQARPAEDAATWRQHRERLETAVRLQPEHAGAHADLAALHVAGAALEGLSEEEMGISRLAAVSHFQQAAALRPADPRLWLGLARAHLLAGDTGPGFQEAWQRAAILGPYEGAVQSGLLEMALSLQPPASLPAMAEWVKTLFDGADERKRQAMQRVAKRYGLSINAEGAVVADPAAPAASAPAPAASR